MCTSSALIFLKLGAGSGAPIKYMDSRVQLNLNPVILLGFFLYGTSFLLYTYLISKYDLGYIIPLTTAFVYVVIFVASFSIFHESFTVAKITGIVFIVVGLIFLNLKK